MKHVIHPGDKYGRLTVIRQVQKAAADGKRYRAALCRCDCGRETTRQAGYAAAKAAAGGLMRSIALEYGRSGITANSVYQAGSRLRHPHPRR